MKQLDIGRLLGFDGCADSETGIDLRDEAIGARLGAKIGEPVSPCEPAQALGTAKPSN